MKKILLLLSILFLFSCNNDSIERILNRNNQLNGSQLDEVTTFIKAYIASNNFYYSYEINNCDSEDKQTEFVNKLFEKNLSTNLKSQINSLEEFKIIGEYDYNIIFKYQCVDGRIVAEIKFEYINGDFKYIREPSEWNEVVDLYFEKIK